MLKILARHINNHILQRLHLNPKNLPHLLAIRKPNLRLLRRRERENPDLKGSVERYQGDAEDVVPYDVWLCQLSVEGSIQTANFEGCG
jgi:hypothetical protein